MLDLITNFQAANFNFAKTVKCDDDRAAANADLNRVVLADPYDRSPSGLRSLLVHSKITIAQLVRENKSDKLTHMLR